jgi:hypothetical protein
LDAGQFVDVGLRLGRGAAGDGLEVLRVGDLGGLDADVVGLEVSGLDGDPFVTLYREQSRRPFLQRVSMSDTFVEGRSV